MKHWLVKLQDLKGMLELTNSDVNLTDYGLIFEVEDNSSRFRVPKSHFKLKSAC